MKDLARRTMLGLGPIALAACGDHERYFGRPKPPSTQRLVYEVPAEPTGFDAASSAGIAESYIWPALVETLVSWNPETLEPQAALATHYQVDPKLTEFIFYLRGHPNPCGVRLPGVAIREPPYQHLATTPSWFYCAASPGSKHPRCRKIHRGGTANRLLSHEVLQVQQGSLYATLHRPGSAACSRTSTISSLNYDVIMHQESHGMEAARNTPSGLVLICSAPSVIETWKALWQSSQLVGIRPKQLLG
jgi:hypothetical protein